MAKIEIWSKDVANHHLEYLRDPQHFYLIYTDNNGNREILRGGPSDHGLGLNNLKIIKQDYNVQNQPDGRPTQDKNDGTHIGQILYENVNEFEVLAKWEAMWAKAQEINAGNYDYEVGTQNSNTAVYQMTKAVGLENKITQFETSNHLWAPALEYALDHHPGDRLYEVISDGLQTSGQTIETFRFAVEQNVINFYDWSQSLSETYQISIATIYQEIGMKIGEKKAISTSENETFKGANEYLFSYSNFGNDVIDNSNEVNNTDKEIHIGNDQLKGLALTTAVNNYRLGNYMLTKSGAGNFEIGTDIIIKPINTAYADSILIKDFKQGDYGIYFLEETAKQSGNNWNTLFTKLSEITGNTSQQLLQNTGNLFAPIFGLWQVNQGVNSIPGLGYTGDMAQWFVKSLTDSLLNGIYGIYGLLNNGTPATVGINGAISGALNQVGAMRRDPLMLDLDGDGLELAQLNQSGVFFDLDGDGRSEHTAWVKEDDGFLAIKSKSAFRKAA